MINLLEVVIGDANVDFTGKDANVDFAQVLCENSYSLLPFIPKLNK